jgi:hypothetical protein
LRTEGGSGEQNQVHEQSDLREETQSKSDGERCKAPIAPDGAVGRERYGG